MSSSSGYFDTIIYQNAIPLVDNNTPYSTLTMFAVGSNNSLAGYTFYEYQKASGFKDTSTIVTELTAAFNSSIVCLQISSSIWL